MIAERAAAGGQDRCRLEGAVVAGKGEAKAFVGLPWARRQFAEKLRLDPYPGTLNLRVNEASLDEVRDCLKRSALVIEPPPGGGCRAFALPAIVEGGYRAFAIMPEVEGYYTDVLELISGEGLRHRLHLEDGAVAQVTVGLKPRRIENRFDSLVVDMDGTIINTLDLFFSSICASLSMGGRPAPVISQVAGVLDEGSGLEKILREAGVGDTDVAAHVASVKREFRARREQEVRPLVGALKALALLKQARGVKIGLATGSTAPRSVIESDLRRFGFSGIFDAVTTGSEIERSKPNPDLILETTRRMGADPGSSLAIGDATMDLVAGERAGCRTAAVLTGVGTRRTLSALRPDFVEDDLLSLASRLVLEGLA